jgi:hypothetical protein
VTDLPPHLWLLIDWLDHRTGQTGTYRSEAWCDEDGQPNLFWWLEGNASCDCNRGIFFLGQSLDDAECGEERFTLLRIRREDTGETVWANATAPPRVPRG